MYEAEELTGGAESETGRFSAFLDYRRDMKEYLHFAIVGWYQPEITDFADTRASTIADLDVDLAGPLALVVSGAWQYDSRPPEGVEEVDWSLRSGVRATF
jgi:hypothetical protein